MHLATLSVLSLNLNGYRNAQYPGQSSAIMSNKNYSNESIVLPHNTIVNAIFDGGFKQQNRKGNRQKKWLAALEQGSQSHHTTAFMQKDRKKPITFSKDITGSEKFSMRTHHRNVVNLLETNMGISIPVMPVGQSSMFNNNLVLCGNPALGKNNKITVKATAIMVNSGKKYVKDSWEFSVKSKPKSSRDANTSVVKYSSYWLTHRFNRDKDAPTWRTSGCIFIFSIADKNQIEHSLALVIGKPKPKERKVKPLFERRP